MIDLSRTLHQLADFLEAQGINMVDTIDGQWYDFSAKIMPNGDGGRHVMTDLEYAEAKQAINDLDMTLPLADFLKQLYWIVFLHHDEESMYVCSMEKHSSFIGGAGA